MVLFRDSATVLFMQSKGNGLYFFQAFIRAQEEPPKLSCRSSLRSNIMLFWFKTVGHIIFRVKKSCENQNKSKIAMDDLIKLIFFP